VGRQEALKLIALPFMARFVFVYSLHSGSS
jgi:hypothetical protein